MKKTIAIMITGALVASTAVTAFAAQNNDTKSVPMEEKTVVLWNFVNILNNILRHKYKNIQDDLFHVVTYANNCGRSP